MDLTFGDADTAFRDEVRAFLAGSLTPELIAAADRTVETYCEFEYGNRWLKILAERGWGQPGWPVEWGGTGWNAVQHYIFNREVALAGAPRGFNNHPGSCILGFGSEEQKARFLPDILKVNTIWAQGYSEPGAGSDLAPLVTSAIADGDDYIVNGTKTWTTYAHRADWLFCLVRTSREGSRQQGITFLLIDLATPGIEIRPIVNLAGQHDFNQVFFRDVRVPMANRVGAENEGWTVAKYFLAFERLGSGVARLLRRLDRVKHIVGMQRASDGGRLADDADVARRLARIEVDMRALDIWELRFTSGLSRGEEPGVEVSATKVLGAGLMQRITELGMQAMGYYGLPYEPDMLTAAANAERVAPAYGTTETLRYFMKRAETIYAGSDEVQRDILAKRFLGL
ncbi:MAG: acyl-CoA dehydrogenase family protein [Gammaproteobacteria bacterium]|nr:acyl-CoA dehydrogenase family protein [Gammaproteobacteria bacterium]